MRSGTLPGRIRNSTIPACAARPATRNVPLSWLSSFGNPGDGKKLYQVIYGVRRVMACQLLLRTAIADSNDPEHDSEVFRFSEMHALRFPKDMPDQLIKILEIRENLDREELTPKERAIHTTRLGAYVKDMSYLKKSDNSGVRKPEGRPRGIVQQVASEVGIDQAAIRNRINTVGELAGVKLDLEKDSAETLHAAAAKLNEAAAADKKAKHAKAASKPSWASEGGRRRGKKKIPLET